jgi:Ca2+-binding EF-hand superfamily protein
MFLFSSPLSLCLSLSQKKTGSIVTGTTVGYGDISPQEPVTRAFSLLYLFVSVVCMAKALSAFGSLLEADDGHAESLLNRKLDETFLMSLDSDGTGEVSEFEYLSAMLVLLEYTEQDDIDGIMKAFRKLDADGSGSLSVDDLVNAKTGHVNNIQSDLRRPKKVFRDCDANGNGALEPREVASALKMLGCEMAEKDFQILFKTIDTNNDGAVSFQEFKRVLYTRIVYEAINDDVNGSLEKEEIRESVEIILKLSVTDQEFEDMFKEIDSDDNGCVTFTEYKKFFKQPKEIKQKILNAREKTETKKILKVVVTETKVEKGYVVKEKN